MRIKYLGGHKLTYKILKYRWTTDITVYCISISGNIFEVRYSARIQDGYVTVID